MKTLKTAIGIGLVAAAAACSGGGGGGGSSGGKTAVSGTVIDAQSAAPIQGATVSVVGGSDQTTSAANGTWTLMLSSNQTVFIRASATNYLANQVGIVVQPGGVTGLGPGLISSSNVSAIAGLLGVTIDPSKGVVLLTFTTDNTGGIGATLSAAHDTSFTVHNGVPQAGSTTVAGSGPTTILGFPNVVTPTTTVTVTGAPSCTPAFNVPNQRVDAGTMTEEDFINCAH